MLKLVRVSNSLQALLCLALSLSLGSCAMGTLLSSDQLLVRKNTLTLAKESKVENWRAYQLELIRLISPEKNGRFLFFFRREKIYLRALQRPDSSRFQSFLRNTVGEPPALLDETLVEQSASQIRNFMLNRGYFDAEVMTQIDTTGPHSAKVKYIVEAGKAYRYDTVIYQTSNPLISALLLSTREDRLLRAKQRIDARIYDAEVARLVGLMRNNGFADFYANSIAPLEADSSGENVMATLRILPPQEGLTHQTYRVGEITVFPDTDPLATSQTVTIDSTFDGIRFIYEGDKIYIDPSTLAQNIFFRPGEVFDQSKISKTNLQLNQLGIFRLVNIQQVPAPDTENEIDFLIQLTPAPRRSVSTEPNINFTDRQTVSGGQLSLIGLQAVGSFSNNNVAGGAEKLNVSADVGVEFNFARINDPNVQRLNTFESGLQSSLELPKFRDYFGIYRGLHKFRTGTDEDGNPIKFISDDFYTTLRERAITRMQVGARYVKLLNFYTTSTLSGSYGYTLINGKEQYAINHLSLTYFRVLQAQPDFKALLENQPFLQRSFGNQVFNAFLFSNLTYTRIFNRGLFGGSYTWLVDLEQSGAEVLAVNAITNSITKHQGAYDLGAGLDYARYGRVNTSISQRLPLVRNTSFAWRLNMGAALTFGYDRRNRDVPYVKQFFAGGANSMRGWAARGVGPGGYEDTLVTLRKDTVQIPYQQAPLKLEANIEFRAPLTKVSSTQVDYALFFDAGNIWTFAEDPSRPLSQFSFTEQRGGDGQLIAEPFYRQVAINTGFGIRWDIQYVLIRLDLGIKLRTPYEIEGSHWPSSFKSRNTGRFGFGLGLNYPF